MIKVIIKVDRFLYDYLPNETYSLIRDTKSGISDAEAKRLSNRLSKLANDKIDIPYIPEKFEYIAIRFVIGSIINAARKKWDFDKVIKNEKYMSIPPKKNAKKYELESIIITN